MRTSIKAIIAAIVMFFIVVFPGGGLWSLFSYLIGGGATATFLFPIYGGIIVLEGLIVGCTAMILDEIKVLKEEIKNVQNQHHRSSQ